MEPQLEKAFKKTINQTTQLWICHKANKKGSFHFVSGGSLLKILKSSPSVQKTPQPDWRTAPSCSNPLEKDFRHSSWFFCSCDTCNCVSVRPKAKQKLVVPVVEWETSTESTSVTESGGETEPSEPLLRAGSCCLSRFWQVTSPQQFPVSPGHCLQHPGRIPFGAITFCPPRTAPDISLGHNTPLHCLS